MTPVLPCHLKVFEFTLSSRSIQWKIRKKSCVTWDCFWNAVWNFCSVINMALTKDVAYLDWGHSGITYNQPSKIVKNVLIQFQLKCVQQCFLIVLLSSKTAMLRTIIPLKKFVLMYFLVSLLIQKQILSKVSWLEQVQKHAYVTNEWSPS